MIFNIQITEHTNEQLNLIGRSISPSEWQAPMSEKSEYPVDYTMPHMH